jgi:hypothetical protein
VYQLVYVSTAKELFSAEELERLLKLARAANHALGVTGLLLYSDGNFMQVLEGERDRVLALMARIRRDPRHKDIRVIFEEDAPGRDFADWSMRFRHLSGSEGAALREALDDRGERAGIGIPKILLRSFYHGNVMNPLRPAPPSSASAAPEAGDPTGWSPDTGPSADGGR